MNVDAQIRYAVYQHFAETGATPGIDAVADRSAVPADAVVESYRRLRASRLLLLEPDGRTIRMAPPFSGVPTQHRVRVSEIDYFANCGWDALGIPAALHRAGTVHSRCEQTHEPLDLEVGQDGPEPSTWVFHSLVPAARWWDDLVFT